MRIHSVEGEPRRRTKRKGIFMRILEALHRSRRRHAMRMLRRYRHLIAGQAQLRPANSLPEFLQNEKGNLNAYASNAAIPVDPRTRRRDRNQFA